MKPDWKVINEDHQFENDGRWYLVKNSTGFVARVNDIGCAIRRDGRRIWVGWAITPEGNHCPISDITHWDEIEER